MNEYQDQSVWYELYGYDGFQWVFVADFDTRDEAEDHMDESEWLEYEGMRVRRITGLAA